MQRSVREQHVKPGRAHGTIVFCVMNHWPFEFEKSFRYNILLATCNCTWFSINFQKIPSSHWKVQIRRNICWVNIWDNNWPYLVSWRSVITCLVNIWVNCGMIFSRCSKRIKQSEHETQHSLEDSSQLVIHRGKRKNICSHKTLSRCD